MLGFVGVAASARPIYDLTTIQQPLPLMIQRAFELPHAVDAQASRAQLENGVLTLTLAHQAPQSQVTPLTVH